MDFDFFASYVCETDAPLVVQHDKSGLGSRNLLERAGRSPPAVIVMAISRHIATSPAGLPPMVSIPFYPCWGEPFTSKRPPITIDGTARDCFNRQAANFRFIIPIPWPRGSWINICAIANLETDVTRNIHSFTVDIRRRSAFALHIDGKLLEMDFKYTIFVKEVLLMKQVKEVQIVVPAVRHRRRF